MFQAFGARRHFGQVVFAGACCYARCLSKSDRIEKSAPPMSDAYDTSGIQVIPKPENLYQLIEQIKVRPAMYLGSNTITALKSFIDGYHFACYMKNVEEELSPPWQDFHEFVRARTGFGESTGGWCHMLLHAYDDDEERGIAAFFEAFEDFSAAQ
jgi:hypothetical protein